MRKCMLVLFGILLISSMSFAQHNFTLESVNGKTVKLSDYTKKGPVLVTFWALWCNPCRAEMKVLNKIYKEYKSKGFTVIAVNTDDTKSTSKVHSFVSSQGFSFPVVLDANKEVYRKFNGNVLPYSILIAKGGKKILKTRTSYEPGDENSIRADVKAALGK